MLLYTCPPTELYLLTSVFGLLVANRVFYGLHGRRDCSFTTTQITKHIFGVVTFITKHLCKQQSPCPSAETLVSHILSGSRDGMFGHLAPTSGAKVQERQFWGLILYLLKRFNV